MGRGPVAIAVVTIVVEVVSAQRDTQSIGGFYLFCVTHGEEKGQH
jgi:hypothetical protein